MGECTELRCSTRKNSKRQSALVACTYLSSFGLKHGKKHSKRNRLTMTRLTSVLKHFHAREDRMTDTYVDQSLSASCL
jgi:hypothetical protein